MKRILNKRLEEISAFINSDDKVIDIGCDHGLLGIYLVQEKNILKMVSSDINKKPLEKAKENILKYHLQDKIELRLGNGLSTLSEDINTIVISGMGGINIIDILKDINGYPNIQKIIISPNNDFPLTRWKMHKYSWALTKEKMVYEKGKYYLISVYQKGNKKNNSFFGILDLSNKDVINYYRDLYHNNKLILSKLSLKNKIKKRKLIWENIKIKRVFKNNIL